MFGFRSLSSSIGLPIIRGGGTYSYIRTMTVERVIINSIQCCAEIIGMLVQILISHLCEKSCFDKGTVVIEYAHPTTTNACHDGGIQASDFQHHLSKKCGEPRQHRDAFLKGDYNFYTVLQSQSPERHCIYFKTYCAVTQTFNVNGQKV